MSKPFIFTKDIRVETTRLTLQAAESLGSSIGRTIAAAVIAGSVMTLSCPDPATAAAISNSCSQQIQQSVPHKVYQQTPDVVTATTLASLFSGASTVRQSKPQVEAAIIEPAQPEACNPGPVQVAHPISMRVESRHLATENPELRSPAQVVERHSIADRVEIRQATPVQVVLRSPERVEERQLAPQGTGPDFGPS